MADGAGLQKSKTEAGAATRDRIERAALSLFVERGVDAATTRDIAAASGLSEGAIYRHFVSKDELASGIFLTIHSRLARLVREAAANNTDIEGRARAVVEAYCRTADEDFALFTFHLLYVHRFLPTPEGVDNPVEAIEDIVSAAIERREIPRRDKALVAGMALGVVLQTALQISYGRLAGPLSAHGPAMTDAVIAILKGA
ncbi:MAG: TetR/AcrR family transcriptional regulator [Parvularculaceae bacterium]